MPPESSDELRSAAKRLIEESKRLRKVSDRLWEQAAELKKLIPEGRPKGKTK